MKVTAFRQEGVSDCAAACVAMILDAFGKSVSMNAIREELGANNPVGTSADDIVALLLRHGIEAWGTLGAPGDLADVEPPAILHWRSEHYVVLEEIVADEAVIVDPLWGARRSLDGRRLRALASGLVLHARPAGTVNS